MGPIFHAEMQKRLEYRTGFSSALLIASLLLVLVSCSEELDIITGAKPVPVVYCIMNPKDSVYKVLLSKTFAGNQSTLLMAQDTSYIYYRDAQVSMEGWGSGYMIWKTDFHPTSATRDSGLFSSLPGYSYETTDVLMSYFGDKIDYLDELGIEYLRLVIKTPDSDQPAYARILPGLGQPVITYPIYNYKTFNICDTIPYYLEFPASPRLYYDIRCRFRYTEFTDVTKDCIIDFLIKQNISVTNHQQRQEISPDLFFHQLASNFPPSSDIVSKRIFNSLDIELQVGSESFKTYMNTYYIDTDQSYTLWNCFHGGIGLFALINKTALTNLKMDQRTKDSLANGQYTKNLKFSKW